METSIHQFHLQAVHGVTAKHTILHCILEALLNSGNKFLRNITTRHRIYELKATFLVVFVHGTYVYNDVSKLTAATRLLLVNLTKVHRLSDGFLVVHLRLTLVALHLELTTQTVNDDVQMELTHTRDNGLAALLISLHGECGILLRQLCQAV